MVENLVANWKKGLNLNCVISSGVVSCLHISACRPYQEDDVWFWNLEFGIKRVRWQIVILLALSPHPKILNRAQITVANSLSNKKYLYNLIAVTEICVLVGEIKQQKFRTT